MRFYVTPSQVNAFKSEGELPFEEVFSNEETSTLKNLLETYPEDTFDHFRLDPAIPPSMKLKALCEMAGAFSNRPMVRVAFTEYPFSGKLVSPMTDTLCFALLNFDDGSVTFHDGRHTPPPSSNLLIAFSGNKARYKQCDEQQPFLNKLGYSSGDVITTETHPYLWRS